MTAKPYINIFFLEKDERIRLIPKFLRKRRPR